MASATADATRRSTAQIVIERLIAHGIDTLFCLPGVQNDPFFDALFAERNRLRPIHTRHEQGAAYLALGAAMATGKPAAYCVVPGPGFLNTTAALSQAYGNNAPVLAISGQIPLAYVNRDTGFLHDIPDQLGIAQRLTKWAARISAAHEAAALTDEALRQMLAGRPWPPARGRRRSNVPSMSGVGRRTLRCRARPSPCLSPSPTMMLSPPPPRPWAKPRGR
jgi:acetolactate synthase I/II/III large subunit